MKFPLGLYDLALWLAVTSIILLTTSEVISPFKGQPDLIIEKSRLRRTALTLGILFLSTAALIVFQVFII